MSKLALLFGFGCLAGFSAYATILPIFFQQIILMNPPTFFIYDFESFGIDPARDRPAQFAGIRTDEHFNIIGEPVMIYCRQTADYLPSPEAVMVTGISPQECNAKGVSEPEFAARIHSEFSQPNTCVMGYNNIRFDDEMTRYTFFRNFFNPYDYSWKNGNSRWDLLDVVRACYALRPEGIIWAYDESGMPSFKLENLTKANGIAHENAHDAMSDVYATIEMAKLIQQKQPKLFQFFLQHRHKKALSELIDVGEMSPLVHVSGMLGNYRGNCAWIAPLEWHPTNKNAVIVCDLAGDVQTLLDLDADTLRTRLYSKKADLEAQGLSSIPLKLVHINKCPILAPAKTLLPENAARLNIDRAQCLANLKLIQSHKRVLREKVIALFSDERQFEVDPNIETSLYQGFFDYADQENMAGLRELPPQQLANHGLTFKDERIEKLLFHYRARHFPETLTRGEQIRWQKYCHQKLDSVAERFQQSMQECFQLYQNHADKIALLNQLEAYAKQLAEIPLNSVTYAGRNDNLLQSINNVAEQAVGKNEKLAMLKALINP